MLTQTKRLPILVRPFAAADREGVRALLGKTFGSPAAFDRFAEGNPLGDFVGVVAEHEGKVVGYNMWNAWLLNTSAEPIVAYQSGASSVDESMRGQGIFGKLLRAGEELAASRGIAVFFGFPNPASLEAFLKNGWRHADTLRMFACTVPSIGIGRVVRSALPDTSIEARFVTWRFTRAGIEARPVLARGERLTAYARTLVWRGAKIHRLLDVVDGRGHRRPDHLVAAVSSLPGPGLTVMRAAPPPGLPWLAVRRLWDTPLIIKRIRRGEGPEDATLRSASYWYGDIDAS
jgi:GNAT superfamily N-acetyltransferase